MMCPNCNAVIAEDSIFCSSCGTRILNEEANDFTVLGMRKCPNCGYDVPSDANFCTNCRTPLAGTAIEESNQPNTLEIQQAQFQMLYRIRDNLRKQWKLMHITKFLRQICIMLLRNSKNLRSKYGAPLQR